MYFNPRAEGNECLGNVVVCSCVSDVCVTGNEYDVSLYVRNRQCVNLGWVHLRNTVAFKCIDLYLVY